MKTFLEHLEDAEKSYEYRIKFANYDPNEAMDQFEVLMDAYGLENISKPKTLPISDYQIDFPNMGAVEVYIVDVVLHYPLNNIQLRAIISEQMNVSPAQIVVVPRNSPEEKWRNGEGELKAMVKGESVLMQEYDEADDTAGNDYRDMKVAGKDVKDKPTVDVVAGTVSPVGSNQNKIPDPSKGN